MKRAVPTVFACLLLACGQGTGPEASIDRETFITTYVALRVTAVTEGLDRLPPALRDSVLAGRGVTEEELLDFAEVHGGDVHFMERVWDEIESRLDTIPLPSRMPR